MADHKRANKVVNLEYTVPMHCNACARRVAKAISKLKGYIHLESTRCEQNIYSCNVASGTRKEKVICGMAYLVLKLGCHGGTGVEKFMTGMTDDRVVVIGRINPEKVLKKLKKKMGKKVELVVNEDQDDEDGAEEEMNCSWEEGIGSWQDHYYGDGETHMMFSDENANSCTMM